MSMPVATPFAGAAVPSAAAPAALDSAPLPVTTRSVCWPPKSTCAACLLWVAHPSELKKDSMAKAPHCSDDLMLLLEVRSCKGARYTLFRHQVCPTCTMRWPCRALPLSREGTTLSESSFPLPSWLLVPKPHSQARPSAPTAALTSGPAFQATFRRVVPCAGCCTLQTSKEASGHGIHPPHAPFLDVQPL